MHPIKSVGSEYLESSDMVILVSEDDTLSCISVTSLTPICVASAK